MSFNGNEGAPISPEQAAAYTAAWRAAQPGSTQGVFYGYEILNRILAQPGCMGIRMYFALDEQGKATLVLAGADAQENDMLNGVIADVGHACPPVCGQSNFLNS